MNSSYLWKEKKEFESENSVQYKKTLPPILLLGVWIFFFLIHRNLDVVRV